MRKALAIARVAFLELVTDKLLYNTLLTGVALLGLAWAGASLALIHTHRILQDFGLAAIDLSCAAIGLLAGATALPRAFEKRTVILVLSRPVSRAELVGGTYLGCAALVFVNWLLLPVALWGLLAGFAGSGPDPAVLAPALVLGLLQALVLAAVAVASGSFLTSSLAVAFSVMLFLGGANVSQLRAAAVRAPSDAVRLALRALASALPNFEVYSLSFLTSYALPLPVGQLAFALGYGLVVILACLAAASLLIRFRSV